MSVSRLIGMAAATVAVLWLMLDSGWVAEPAPRVMSASLGALGGLFTLGGTAMWLGGRPERAPQWLGLGLGVVGYALARLTFVTA